MAYLDDSTPTSDSLSDENLTGPPPALGASRAGETSGERRLRLLRTVLGDWREREAD